MNLVDSDEKERLFYRELSEAEFENFEFVVRRLVGWKRWDAPPTDEIDRILADNKGNVKDWFKSHELTAGYLMGAKVEDDNVIGQRIAYGFAKYLRDALPGATYLGFAGTPIEATDINTPAMFGNYVDIDDIAQTVEDGSTVRIYYESRLAKVALSDEGRELVRQLDDAIAGEGFTTETRSSRREENDTKISVNSVSPWLNPRLTKTRVTFLVVNPNLFAVQREPSG